MSETTKENLAHICELLSTSYDSRADRLIAAIHEDAIRWSPMVDACLSVKDLHINVLLIIIQIGIVAQGDDLTQTAQMAELCDLHCSLNNRLQRYYPG
jgi:hypothetical protein